MRTRTLTNTQLTLTNSQPLVSHIVNYTLNITVSDTEHRCDTNLLLPCHMTHMDVSLVQFC